MPKSKREIMAQAISSLVPAVEKLKMQADNLKNNQKANFKADAIPSFVLLFESVTILATAVTSITEALISEDDNLKRRTSANPTPPAYLADFYRQRRIDELKEQDLSLKILNYTPVLNDGGTVDRQRNVIIDKINEKCPSFVPMSAKVNVIPLSNKPKPGETTVPLLINFSSTEQKILAEKELKDSGYLSVPNYSKEFYDLIKKIRNCVQQKYPNKQILIRPNPSFKMLNIKIRDRSDTKWTTLTTTKLPFTDREMKNCHMNKNPCNNEHVNI